MHVKRATGRSAVASKLDIRLGLPIFVPLLSEGYGTDELTMSDSDATDSELPELPELSLKRIGRHRPWYQGQKVSYNPS